MTFCNELLEKENFFSSMSRLFVKRWFRSLAISPETALFLAYMMESFLEGHLCVTVKKNEIFPNPRDLWIKREMEDIDETQKEQFVRAILEGFSNLSEIFFEKEERLENIPTKPFILKQNSLYFQKCWLLEKRFLDLVLKKFCPVPLNFDIIKKELTQLFQDEKLKNIGQREALERGLNHPFFIISGGPGSGKTHSLVHLVELFIKAWPLERTPRILITAPTGKATQRLEELFNQFSTIKEKNLEIKTLHAHLKLRKDFDFFAAEKLLDADLMVIDEASMIDLEKAYQLLAALPPTCRVIFVGDSDQLPPIELGSFFSELCHNKNFAPQVSRLQGSHRFDATWQVFFESIRLGKSDQVLNFLHQQKNEENIKFYSFKDFLKTQELYEFIFSMVENHYEKSCSDHLDVFVQNFLTFRILSPLRKGPYGVERINDFCFTHFKKKKEPALYIPILITQNDYRLGLFNGTTGVALLENDKINKVYFSLSQGKDFSIASLPHHEIAYAMSVHKSQGSEFDNLLLILPPGSEIFGREMLYTALTRARKKITMISTEEILQAMISKSSKKNSGLLG